MKAVWPYLVTLLLGAAICWGILASRQSKEVATWKAAVSAQAEQTRLADSARKVSDSARIADARRFDSLSQPNPELPRLIQERNAARQEARTALGLAQTTSDSLQAVSEALRGSEAREDALLVTIAKRDQTIAELRTAGLARMASDSGRIADVTKERDRWKELAEAAPVSQIPETWLFGLPRPVCVVGPGVTVGGRVTAGASLTCGMPIG